MANGSNLNWWYQDWDPAPELFQVDNNSNPSSELTVLDGFASDLGGDMKRIEIRLVGNDAHCAAERAGTEQGSLRPT